MFPAKSSPFQRLKRRPRLKLSDHGSYGLNGARGRWTTRWSTGRRPRGVRPDVRSSGPPLALLRAPTQLAAAPDRALGDIFESEAATVSAMWLGRIYDQSHVALATDEGEAREAKLLRRIATLVLKYWLCKRAPWHAAECLECHGGNGYVEESPMPRLLRESPLQSIWEGAGNVQALDVLRAIVSRPESVAAFLAEVERARSADKRLDRHLQTVRAELGDGDELESRAPARRGDGARPSRLAAGSVRRPSGCRRFLRQPARGRLGRRLRHAAEGHRRAGIIERHAPDA